MNDLTGDLLAAVVAATPERKEAALKALRGEVETAKPVTGPLLLGMGQAARFLGVSRSTLWRVLQAGTIEKVELFPGSFRVRRGDLMALAAGDFGFTPKVSRRGRPRKDSDQSPVISGQESTNTDKADEGDARFEQLKALADEGNEEATADLFREFEYDYAAGRFTNGDGGVEQKVARDAKE